MGTGRDKYNSTPGCSAEIHGNKHVLKELSLECLSFSGFFSGLLPAPIGQSVAHSLNDMPDLDADLLVIGLRQQGRPLYRSLYVRPDAWMQFPRKT